jgi:hypothetical protein
MNSPPEVNFTEFLDHVNYLYVFVLCKHNLDFSYEMKKGSTTGLFAVGKKSEAFMLAIAVVLPVLVTFCAVPAPNNAEAADLPDQTYVRCLQVRYYRSVKNCGG